MKRTARSFRQLRFQLETKENKEAQRVSSVGLLFSCLETELNVVSHHRLKKLRVEELP